MLRALFQSPSLRVAAAFGTGGAAFALGNLIFARVLSAQDYGTLSLFINDEKVGEGQIMTQPGNFSLVGEGLNVGRDPAEPITDDYPGTSPYAFTGGRIKQAIVDVSGEPFIDLEKEAIAMMARE